jgi:hypothetical protein
MATFFTMPRRCGKRHDGGQTCTCSFGPPVGRTGAGEAPPAARAILRAMTRKMSRRGLGSVALAGFAAGPGALTQGVAQTSLPTPKDDLEAAQRSLKTASRELNQFSIPRGTEPAFLFRA